MFRLRLRRRGRKRTREGGNTVNLISVVSNDLIQSCQNGLGSYRSCVERETEKERKRFEEIEMLVESKVVGEGI